MMNLSADTELVATLVGQAYNSRTGQALVDFQLRAVINQSLAPDATDAVVDGMLAAPDGGREMAAASLADMTDEAREKVGAEVANAVLTSLRFAATHLIGAARVLDLPDYLSPDAVALVAASRPSWGHPERQADAAP